MDLVYSWGGNRGEFDIDELVRKKRNEENFGVVKDPLTKQPVRYPSFSNSFDENNFSSLDSYCNNNEKSVDKTLSSKTSESLIEDFTKSRIKKTLSSKNCSEYKKSTFNDVSNTNKTKKNKTKNNYHNKLSETKKASQSNILDNPAKCSECEYKDKCKLLDQGFEDICKKH